MTFDEQDIRRDTGGRFDHKNHSAPEAALAPTLNDPWEYFPTLPTAFTAEFENATTFAEVDEARAALRGGNGGFSDDLGVRWAAINRGRELRKSGAGGVPTKLDERHPFRDAQNDTELVELYSLATEELHGDGMNSMSTQNRLRNGYWAQLSERRNELLEADAVTGGMQL